MDKDFSALKIGVKHHSSNFGLPFCFIDSNMCHPTVTLLKAEASGNNVKGINL